MSFPQANRSGTVAIFCWAAVASMALATEPAANLSFELPERAAGQAAARPEVEGWQAQQAGVAANDGSWGAVLKGVDGQQVGYIAAAANSQLVQDLPGGLEANSQHVFGVKVGLRSDAAPTPGSSLALRLQTTDGAGRALANLAVATLIVGREELTTDGLTPFEVVFTTGASVPAGKVRLVMDVIEPSTKAESFWVVDSANWEVNQKAAPPKAVAATSAAKATYSYSKDIGPILAENCFACHGPDASTREARLRLDVREVATSPNKEGRSAIVPGDPKSSEAYQRIISKDEEEIMPPPDSHKTLTSDQIAKIRTWIEEGAVYQKHWAYEPIVRPALPVVRQPDWVRQPMDAFILAKLEANGLKPAPEAERHTLARRAALDLTGLPPTPEMLDGYLADKAPGAYERYVERLLALPSWGEHRGRYWLDVARYADTHGIHFDNYREIWGYRDWVIKAFNRNLPFDQFTIEQLAGDLLPSPTEEQIIATGYNRCNISTNEGGVIEEEYRVLYSIDRTDTMARAWLGLTAACASCHDHKFDPLPTKDFYSLAAFFNNSTTSVLDGNVKDPPPTQILLEGADRLRWDELTAELPVAEDALRKFYAEAEKRYEAKMDASGSVLFNGELPTSGVVYQAELSGLNGGALPVSVQGKPVELAVGKPPVAVAGPTGGQALQLAEPGLALAGLPPLETNKPFSVGLWVKVEDLGQTGSLLARMDDEGGFRGFDIWFAGGAVGTHILRAFPGDCIKVVAEGPGLQAKRWHHVMLSYDGTATAVGTRIFIDGVEQQLRIEVDNLKGSIATDVPLRLGRREHRDAIQGLSVAGLNFFDRLIGRDEVNRLAVDHGLREILARPAEKRTAAERKRLLDAYFVRVEGPGHGALVDKVAKLKAEMETIRTRTPATLVFKEAETLPTAFVLNRGEYDQRRDLVSADTPGALPPMAGDLPRNRLGLAKWLVSAEQPLTARVTANRFWLEVFGQGIVTTPGDFGLSGALPSHPELLDWLAAELRENGWDVKRFYKMLVTSAAYRQASVYDAERLEKDPSNILLSRGPRFRMDAEMIRDNALATSGLLVPKIGGPSVKPYQPDGVWEAVAMFESNTRNYVRDKDDSLYRRSMYTFWKRSAPPAAMDVFNAPSRETCTIQRERGNTPLQALASLNDPQLAEAARNLAQRAIQANPGEGGDAGRIEFMTKRLIARALRPEEMDVVVASLKEMRGFYAADGKAAESLIKIGASPADGAIAPAELAAWTLIANQLMNLDEVLAK